MSLLDFLSKDDAPVAKPRDPAEGMGEFTKGVVSGAAGLRGSIAELGGNIVENFSPDSAKGFYKYADEAAQEAAKYPGRVTSLSQVHGLRDLGSFGLNQFGNAVPSLAMSLAGGGVGGLAAKTLGAGVKMATTAGLAAGAYPPIAGEIAGELRHDPEAMANTTAGERSMLALGGAIPGTALEVLPEAMALGRAFGVGNKIKRGFMPAMREVGAGALETATGEGITEGAQQVNTDFFHHLGNENYDILHPQEIMDSAAGGFFGGAPVGAVAGGTHALRTNLGLTPAEGDTEKAPKEGLFSTLYKLGKYPETSQFMMAMKPPEDVMKGGVPALTKWISENKEGQIEAGTRAAQRIMADRGSSASDKEVSAAFLANPTDPEVLKTFYGAMSTEMNGANVRRKLDSAVDTATKTGASWLKRMGGYFNRKLDPGSKANAEELDLTDDDKVIIGNMLPNLSFNDKSTVEAAYKYLLAHAQEIEENPDHQLPTLVMGMWAPGKAREGLDQFFSDARRAGLTGANPDFDSKKTLDDTTSRQQQWRKAIYENLALKHGSPSKEEADDLAEQIQSVLQMTNGLESASDYIEGNGLASGRDITDRDYSNSNQLLDDAFGRNKDRFLSTIRPLLPKSPNSQLKGMGDNTGLSGLTEGEQKDAMQGMVEDTRHIEKDGTSDDIVHTDAPISALEATSPEQDAEVVSPHDVDNWSVPKKKGVADDGIYLSRSGALEIDDEVDEMGAITKPGFTASPVTSFRTTPRKLIEMARAQAQHHDHTSKEPPTNPHSMVMDLARGLSMLVDAGKFDRLFTRTPGRLDKETNKRIPPVEELLTQIPRSTQLMNGVTVGDALDSISESMKADFYVSPGSSGGKRINSDDERVKSAIYTNNRARNASKEIPENLSPSEMNYPDTETGLADVRTKLANMAKSKPRTAEEAEKVASIVAALKKRGNNILARKKLLEEGGYDNPRGGEGKPMSAMARTHMYRLETVLVPEQEARASKEIGLGKVVAKQKLNKLRNELDLLKSVHGQKNWAVPEDKLFSQKETEYTIADGMSHGGSTATKKPKNPSPDVGSTSLNAARAHKIETELLPANATAMEAAHTRYARMLQTVTKDRGIERVSKDHDNAVARLEKEKTALTNELRALKARGGLSKTSVDYEVRNGFDISYQDTIRTEKLPQELEGMGDDPDKQQRPQYDADGNALYPRGALNPAREVGLEQTIISIKEKIAAGGPLKTLAKLRGQLKHLEAQFAAHNAKPGMKHKEVELPFGYSTKDFSNLPADAPRHIREAWEKQQELKKQDALDNADLADRERELGYESARDAMPVEDSFSQGQEADPFEVHTTKANAETTNAEKLGPNDERPHDDDWNDIVADLERMLGKDTHTAELVDDLGGNSGTWTPGNGINKASIKVCTFAKRPLSVGMHEAMHEFMKRLADEGHFAGIETLKTVAMSPIMQRRLSNLLEGNEAAQKQLSDPEEAVAYMFQFWQAEQIELSAKTEGIMNKIMNWLKHVFGIMNNHEQAGLIFAHFYDGNLASIETRGAQMDQITSANKSFFQVGRKLTKHFDKLVGTVDWRMRNSGSKAMRELIDLFQPELNGGSRSKLFNSDQDDIIGHFAAVSQMGNKGTTEIEELLKGYEKSDVSAALEYLQKGTAIEDIDLPVVAGLVRKTRDVLKKYHDYMSEAGVTDLRGNAIGKLSSYFPRVWNVDELVSKGSEFVDALLKHHTKELQGIADNANNAAKEDEKNDYTAQDVAETILSSITHAMGVEEGTTEQNGSRLGFTPLMAAANERKLKFLNMEHFSQYLEKDYVRTMSTYVMQTVKRAEYARRFGPDGIRIRNLMDEAKKEWFNEAGRKQYGGSFEKTYKQAQTEAEDALKLDQKLKYEEVLQEKLADKFDDWKANKEVLDASRDKMMSDIAPAIQALEGTLGADISNMQRKLNSNIMAYQNIRLLALNIFSSLIDPLGIVIRGGKLKHAQAAFVRGMKEVYKEWRGNPSGNEDVDVALAEKVGVRDASALLDALGQTYSSMYMHGTAKKLNDAMFKWNGMEAWNRSMRIQATMAAIDFLTDIKNNPGQHGERHLKELGLSMDDLVLKDGKLKLDKKVQQAVVRWVDGAVLRPNAAQRPAWASNPKLALFFHLMQFTYSFQKVILGRAAHEFKNGNYSPVMTLAIGYIPMMIAADIVKGLIQGGGDEPEWMKSMGPGDWLLHGVSRAGLTGVPGGLYGNWTRPDPNAENIVSSTASRFGSIAGPSVDQVLDGVFQPAGETAIEAGPLQTIYKGWFV